MPTPDVTFVPAMSQDRRVRVYRGNRVRVRPDHFSGPETFNGMEVDCYLLTTERFLLLCDTMICPEDMAIVTQDIQGEQGKRPLLVMNSHADWDHAWGNSYFTGEHIAPIIAQQHCHKRMESEKDQTFLAGFQREYPNHFNSVTITPPTITFQDNMTLYGGDLTIELFSAPGHCQDHIAAWIPELRLLLGFDALETPFPLIKDVSGVQDMFDTLEHFVRLQPRHVLCSHGGTTSPAIIQANLDYFREIERRCRTLLTQRLPTDTELVGAASLLGYSLEEAVAPSPAPSTSPNPSTTPFMAGPTTTTSATSSNGSQAKQQKISS
ncbi:hypothetical protein KDW_59870 [Dictyobacter vulcani]|uniref:Metallo-beta-lactamase domain-containing protein n=1 Tax=Dictyobacter vulcani TaxID=2607529 RepID=A0A5J4KV47_9CHLR|nr:MBL fold metallo-hydrolase [Dictyobacter vulcani]GER91825.1 hypothetical protein KDW_59870 [Dictyobacter vulcani]